MDILLTTGFCLIEYFGKFFSDLKNYKKKFQLRHGFCRSLQNSDSYQKKALPVINPEQGNQAANTLIWKPCVWPFVSSSFLLPLGLLGIRRYISTMVARN